MVLVPGMLMTLARVFRIHWPESGTAPTAIFLLDVARKMRGCAILQHTVLCAIW